MPLCQHYTANVAEIRRDIGAPTSKLQERSVQRNRLKGKHSKSKGKSPCSSAELTQQPAGGYSDEGALNDSVNYSGYQNPTSPYGQTAAPEPILTSGLGNGVNLQPSYYSGGNVDLGWDLMKNQPQIKSVRIEIEAGQEPNAQRWIKEAVDNEYSVIATFHSAAMLTDDQLLVDDPSQLLQAAGWWVTNYPTLSKAGSFTINLMNEWGSHEITANDFAATYNKAIDMVRQVYDGPIIVDVPGFGQAVHTAKLAVTSTTGATINDAKIILSTHIYPVAWNSAEKREMTTADIDELASTGLPCIVGEFGNQPSDGKAKWDDLVRAAKSKGWPVFGWAWNGDGHGMNMIQPFPFQPLAAETPYKYTASAYLKTICDLL